MTGSWKRYKALFSLPFNDLMFQAQTLHRTHFDPNAVQVSTLLSIKTGACPEGLQVLPRKVGITIQDWRKKRLLEVEKVVKEAEAAKEKGASRFCMGGGLA